MLCEPITELPSLVEWLFLMYLSSCDLKAGCIIVKVTQHV